MKKLVYILVISFLFINACSTKKNTFINRNYHGMTAKYNVLYNGKIALQNGIDELDNQYKDNYWEILPIEPLSIEEETPIKITKRGLESEEGAEETKTQFEIAEEKAVKSVQKHGMEIGGEEHNKQTDDAYLLLGKSRYYSQRFVPALEAFDYLLKNFQTEDLGHELNIWKAKTQIRLQNEERAIQTLRNLLNYEELTEETREKGQTALAMAYLAIDSIDLATKALEQAVETQNDKNQYARNLIILGQLYRKQNNIDSSQLAFKKILAFPKSPNKYKMHAYFEQAKNINDSINYKDLQLQFAKLIKEYENKNYLDELHYHNALMDFRDGNDSLALDNLSKSIHAPNAKNFQKGLSYERLGDFYFDKAQFINAGAYYDSVLESVNNDNTKRIRKLKRKRKSLDEVILHETTLTFNDSVLVLVGMSETERKEYFERYIAKLQKADEIAAIIKENEERALNNPGGSGANAQNEEGKNSGGIQGKWYFYNTQAVGFGKAGFQRIWGNRKLKDNWRFSEKTDNVDTAISEGKTTLSDASLAEAVKYDVDYYLKEIPSEESEIQKMRDENSNALYQVGLLYKEKFQEYELATKRFERFLAEKPKEKLVLPAKYHLFRIYEITGNQKLEASKQDILASYPDSRFSQMIQNPDEIKNPKSIKAPEVHYEKVYCDYEFERYESTLEQCNEAIKQYVDNPIQAKFELLKSYAVYKLEGKDPFKKELEYVTVNYPKTEEAEHAQDMLDFLNGVKKPKKEEKKRTKQPDTKTKKNPAQSRPNSKSGGEKGKSRRGASEKKQNRGEGSNSGGRPPGNNNQNNNNNNNNNSNSDRLGG